jgi:hypothetical protein
LRLLLVFLSVFYDHKPKFYISLSRMSNWGGSCSESQMKVILLFYSQPRLIYISRQFSN